jgi:hypothetical protein
MILARYGQEGSYRFTSDNFATFGSPTTVRTPNVLYEAVGTIEGKVATFNSAGELYPSTPAASGLSAPLDWRSMSNNATPALVVTNSRVGVGVAAPIAPLDVKGSGTGRVTVGTMDGATEFGTISLNGGNSAMGAGEYNLASSPDDKTLYINVPSGQAMRFTVDGSTMILLSAIGNVTMSGVLEYSAKWVYWRTNEVSTPGGTITLRYLGD